MKNQLTSEQAKALINELGLSKAINQALGDITQAGISRDLNVRPQTVSDAVAGRCTSLRIQSHVSLCTGVPLHIWWPDLYNEDGTPKKRRGRPVTRGLFDHAEA